MSSSNGVGLVTMRLPDRAEIEIVERLAARLHRCRKPRIQVSGLGRRGRGTGRSAVLPSCFLAFDELAFEQSDHRVALAAARILY